MAGKDISALIEQAEKLSKELHESPTQDRGKKLTDRRRFTLATGIAVSFGNPQSLWQRGSNESTSGLPRQYVPKGPTYRCVRKYAKLAKGQIRTKKKGRLPAAFPIQRGEPIKRQPKPSRSVCGDIP